MARHRLTRRLLQGALILPATLLVASCGSSASTPPGLTISGPGLQTSQPASGPNRPAWKPEYEHLAQRLKQIGIPPGGQEKFHIHALLHIYVNGLLRPLPANIGLDPAKGIESSMHTHDGTGIIHMEAPHPFKYTLGDFFAVWGVKLGPAQVGGLKGYGGDRLHFYLNGKPLSNPAALVLHKDDSIVMGYGPPSGYPHNPSKFLLTEVDKGEGGLGCGAAKKGEKTKSCLAPKAPSGTATTGAS
ncbi:MAG TPA: hypothetical protein VN672_06655 [Solirubrobacteraceae bacterium]|nr:hypothetical protein [Solirubrobacteraceae bacterium]